MWLASMLLGTTGSHHSTRIPLDSAALPARVSCALRRLPPGQSAAHLEAPSGRVHCLAPQAAGAGKGWVPGGQACPGRPRREGPPGRAAAARGVVLQAGCTPKLRQAAEASLPTELWRVPLRGRAAGRCMRAQPRLQRPVWLPCRARQQHLLDQWYIAAS